MNFNRLILTMILGTLTFKALGSNLQQDINFLASDELRGRRAGSPENAVAVNYLKDQLSKITKNSSSTVGEQVFTIFTKMTKSGENSLTTDGEISSFEPLSFSMSGELADVPIVFAGFGITIPAGDPNLIYDDYEGLNVEGKIVVVLANDPGARNPQSKFRDVNYMKYRTLIYKLNNAVFHKAKALIVVQDPMSLNSPGEDPELYFNESDGGGSRFSILAGMSKISWANKILKRNGQKDLLSWQQSVSQSQRPNSFELAISRAKLKVNLLKNTGRVKNVYAHIPGNHPDLKEEMIVIGAHFDHLGMGGQSSLEGHRLPVVHNGADDNASGTSLVLNLARKLQAMSLKRSVMITFFNAEEEGLLGSKHFVQTANSLSEDYGSIVAMLNFDMVGRLTSSVKVMGTNSAFEWDQVLSTVRTPEDLNIEIRKSAVGSSDHASFIQKKIPALFFTTGPHDDYHRSTDDVHKINIEGMKKLEQYALNILQSSIQNEVLTFNPDALEDEDPGRVRGYGAHLGCVPQFGQDETIIGVLCTRTVQNSPAQQAGVTENDVIIKIGEVEINNIYDLAFALKFYRAGDVIDLAWKRGELVIKKKVKLTTRSKVKSLKKKCSHKLPTL
jgi:aminopeptidase YwaD